MDGKRKELLEDAGFLWKALDGAAVSSEVHAPSEAVDTLNDASDRDSRSFDVLIDSSNDESVAFPSQKATAPFASCLRSR